MSEKVIDICSISKVYADRSGLLRYFGRGKRKSVQALYEITFSIHKGECVGLIGGNGAGKSTLLRILAGITLPDSGHADVNGRMATLLEVGTGMHPDLTGRQNIGLAASLMGMSLARIESVTDEIIAFADIGEAMDRPLRTYSSGMRLRLGFAIAAHVDADIIALDEALAVGDTAFQARCLERVMDLRHSGRTILFVSHDLSAVARLCTRAVVLHQGHLAYDGPMDSAIRHYRELMTGTNGNSTTGHPSGIRITHQPEHLVFNVDEEISFTMRVEMNSLVEGKEIDLGIHVNDVAGHPIHHFSNKFTGTLIRAEGNGVAVNVRFKNHLKTGDYRLSIYVAANDEQLVWLPDSIFLRIEGAAPYGYHTAGAVQAPVVVPFTIDPV